jgi:hypothetical protein
MFAGTGTLAALVGALLLALGLKRCRRSTWRSFLAFLVAGCSSAAVGVSIGIGPVLPQAASVRSPGELELLHARGDFLRQKLSNDSEHERVLQTRVRTAARKAAGGQIPTRSETLSWFEHARLGLFIHYGPSTLLAAPTDERWWDGLRSPRLRSAVRRFDPDLRAPEEWIALAKRLGASYVTVTAKHHDGFCLWPSDLTGWDVRRENDLIARVAKAARQAHVRLFVYYSLFDLHERSYSDSESYLAFVEGQLRELLTRYGPIAGVWLDAVNAEITNAQLDRIYRLVHRVQPWALVATNHHRTPLPGEDFQVFENAFPGQRGPGVIATPISSLHHEVAIKLGPTWFWGGADVQFEPGRLAVLLRRASARHSNLLIDIPPRIDGRFSQAVWALAKGD